MTKETKLFCENCSLKCIASDCDCVCHTQTLGFNYGLEEGKRKAKAKIIQMIKEDALFTTGENEFIKRIEDEV